MAGHYGSVRVTSRNLRLVRIDSESNVLLVRGAVPGPNGRLCGGASFRQRIRRLILVGDFMISVPVRDMAGAECGTYAFEPSEISDVICNQLLHDAVVMYNANRRVGEVQTKSRGMVAGSTRKLFKQKGTGRARAGAIRTPVRRGGGHAFGKKPRDYYYRLPKKAIRKAMRMALLSKFQDSQAVMLKSWQCAEPKTKVVAGFLNAVGLAGKSVSADD